MTQFIDHARIEVKAGDGGSGRAGFRREKYLPKGGPDGGDGGCGGSVIFQADHNLGTLLDFKYQRFYAAEDGQPGGKNQRSGKSGADLVLKVPVGTLIIDNDSGESLADLDKDGKQAVAAEGGNGGWGNVHFKSPVNRAPRRANKGLPGPRRPITLELKLVADVGVVGYPNAGKSTFIARVSSARPKVADYPFTTLVPNLGEVEWEEFKSFYIADIPGLIEGAADGKGLGHQFLRHAERTRLLVHLIDPVAPEDGRAPLCDFETINRELKKYSKELAQKPQIVVVNKVDAFTDKTVQAALLAEFKDRAGVNLRFMSAVTGEGAGSLVKLIGRELEKAKSAKLFFRSPGKGGLSLDL